MCLYYNNNTRLQSTLQWWLLSLLLLLLLLRPSLSTDCRLLSLFNFATANRDSPSSISVALYSSSHNFCHCYCRRHTITIITIATTTTTHSTATPQLVLYAVYVCVSLAPYMWPCVYVLSIEPNVLHNFYMQQNKTATYRWICGDIGLFRKPLLSSSSSSSCVCCVEKEESDFLHCFSNFPFHFVSFFFSIFSLLWSFGPLVFVFRLLHSAHFCNNCNRMNSEHGR